MLPLSPLAGNCHSIHEGVEVLALNQLIGTLDEVADRLDGAPLNFPVVHAPKRAGSFLPSDEGVNQLAESLKFAQDGRIVFCSEQDGRNHLYILYSDPEKVHLTTGVGKAFLLTQGDFDVEDVELGPDKTTLLYTSNAGDVDRRHISQIRLSWFDPVPKAGMITWETNLTGREIEWHPLILADGKTVVCLGSSATSPAMPYFLAPGGRKMIAANALPKDFPSAQLVQPQQVVFRSEDGLEIHGQLFLPRNHGQSTPALIFVHGGPPRQMMLGFHYMYYYHNAYAENQYLASLGYVVLSVNYRLGIMYGRAFREAANAGWRGSSEYKPPRAGCGWKYYRDLSLPTLDTA